MLAHLYSQGDSKAANDSIDLINDEQVRRRAAERAAKIEGKGYEVLPAILTAAVIKAIKNQAMGVKSLLGDTKPFRLTQVEADAEAYINSIEDEDLLAFANAISYAAGVTPEILLSIYGPGWLSWVTGTLSSAGSAADESARSGKSNQEAMDDAYFNAVMAGMLAPFIDKGVDKALSPTSLLQEIGAEGFKGALTEFDMNILNEARDSNLSKQEAAKSGQDNYEYEPYPLFESGTRSTKRR